MNVMPVLLGYDRQLRRYTESIGCPETVPMSLLTEEWAQRNHSQSLAMLASRGGLSPLELIAVMDKQPFNEAQAKFKNDCAGARELVRRMLSWPCPQ